MRRFRHLETTFGVALDTSPDRLLEFVERVRVDVVAHPGVSDKRRTVRLNDLAAPSAELLLDCYLVASDTATELAIREDVLLGVLRVAHGMRVLFAGSA